MINKNIYLLGATGSIGSQVLEIIRNSEFVLKGCSCGKNIKKMEEIINEFHPKYVSVIKKSDYEYLQNKYPDIEFGYGEDGLIKTAIYNKEEDGTVINAVVGICGLKPTYEAIKASRNVLLANKETLVVGGEIIIKLAKEKNVRIIPVDSEHNAISRLLDNHHEKTIEKIIITASGGSFLHKNRTELENVTVKEALNHPNWSMGSKITIDSATMVNKGLEVIEAHYLFDVEYDQIETVIHKQSIIHSMVEFVDGTVTALMYKPTMKNPISYAMFNEEVKSDFPKIDFTKSFSLDFQKMDYERFPMIKLAYEVGKEKGIMPCVYNAANEVCVELFLKGKIKFLEIENIITETVKEYRNKNSKFLLSNEISIDLLLNVDSEVREKVLNKLSI